MPSGYPRKNCRICGRHRDDCGDLSKRGKCQDCAQALMDVNIHNLQLHQGPFFRHWRRNMALSVGGVLVDDEERG